MFAQRWPACALTDGETMAPTRQHLHSQKLLLLLRAALGRAPVSATPLSSRLVHQAQSGLEGLGGRGEAGGGPTLGAGAVGQRRGGPAPRWDKVVRAGDRSLPKISPKGGLPWAGGFVTPGGGAMPFTARVTRDVNGDADGSP